jgi:crotonobetainyl-CoA:carnitine CoA-transferase CaiB-like acyl-CoA transferase
MPPPTLNQHAKDILSQILGLSQQEIAQLAEAGIIGKLI